MVLIIVIILRPLRDVDEAIFENERQHKNHGQTETERKSNDCRQCRAYHFFYQIHQPIFSKITRRQISIHAEKDKEHPCAENKRKQQCDAIVRKHHARIRERGKQNTADIFLRQRIVERPQCQRQKNERDGFCQCRAHIYINQVIRHEHVQHAREKCRVTIF